MKHRAFITTAAVCILACSCNNKKQDNEQLSLIDASRQELVTALADRDQLLTLVTEITTGMDQIKHLENILTVTNAQPNENSTQRAQILADIASIQQTLKQRRERLAELEVRLQQSVLYNDEMQHAIDVLNRQIESQAHEIDSLRAQLTTATVHIEVLTTKVDSLNTTVEEVSTERAAAQEASVQLENELNTCYYVAAPMAELKRHNIIETGFLRKSRLLKGDFDKGFFVISDKRCMDTLHLNSSKAKIHTNHPNESYEITEMGGMKVLRITDSDRFWELSNYLVIQID